MAQSRAEKAAYMKQYFKDRPEKYKAQQARQYAQKRSPEHWRDYRLSSLKCRCKKTGMEFNLSHSDLILPEVCPVLGIPLILGVAATHPSSPHVDRVDNSQGYIPGNVRIISGRANILKKDATVAEIRAILKYMES